MQLTLYTDYSLRALLFLALQPEHTATITAIANSYGISRNHLVKVVHNLGAKGFIRTVRGRGGGLMLGRCPEDINIGDVVRQTEMNFELVECFSLTRNTCPITSVCTLKGVLAEAQKSFIAVLDRYTLTDMLQNKDEVKMILQVKNNVGQSSIA